MPVPHHLVFIGQMPFLPPNQQHQSIEGLPQNIMHILTGICLQWNKKSYMAVILLVIIQQKDGVMCAKQVIILQKRWLLQVSNKK